MAPSPQSPAFWTIFRLEKALMNPSESETTSPQSRFGMTLSDKPLKTMGIERVPRELDIENPTPVDAYPVFFEPLADTPDLQKGLCGGQSRLDMVALWKGRGAL
jgi:hypothetical protein